MEYQVDDAVLVLYVEKKLLLPNEAYHMFSVRCLMPIFL